MRLRPLPVGATPRLQLAHRTAADGTYDLYPITGHRPEVGIVDTSATCGTCGESVPLRLSSAEWVRARRHHQLLVGVTVYLTAVAAGALFLTQDVRYDWGGVPGVLGCLVAVLVLIGAGSYFSESREEDGVVSLDPAHTLREPGDRHDYADSDGGNYEAGL
ncbi:hypothetical protein [Actinoplanes couchii]|uniref:Integral membrane protein n=1 Tax=Actinoplanes couchii TaxID=403638 RepID=A0ABQ3X552_9ACTN|nr:hypothetical protein [Actinoplanes couchii]MDR6325994.1 hypothetical protein [Actinoplanes couchii]GID53653.1 hypothetical protein Aco03nite_020570 [Actinoplanes couchii]